MRFTVSVATAVMAFAAAAFAQSAPTADFDPVTKPESNEVVPAGKTYEITWQVPDKYAAETISISLIGGETQDTQVPLSDIATGVANADGKYSWAVDDSLGAENVYGLVVKLESNPDVFQYSNPFKIKAGKGDSGDSGDTTVIVTTDTGVKTIHLSDCPSTSTTSTTSTTPSSTPSSTPTPTPTSTKKTKSKTTVAPTTIVTSTAVVVPPSTTAPATIPPTETPGAAPRVGAGSLAVLGGLVVAALAL